MKSLEEIVSMNNPPLNERLRKQHERNDACVLSADDVHVLVELLDAVEEEPHVSTELRAAMRRLRRR